MDDHVKWDDQISGLGLRVRNGKESYIYRYRIGAKQRSIKLGSGSLPIRTVRRNALELEARVRLGEDPAADIRSAKSEAGNTFKAIAERYLDAHRA
jgi:hypothetical protein